MFDSQGKYERIQSSDDELAQSLNSDDAPKSKHSRRSYRAISGALIVGFLLGVSGYLIWHKVMEHKSKVQPIVVQYQHDNDVVYGCGNSTAEAKSLGCTFNPLSMAWLRDECYDHEITQAFLEAGLWQYYADEAGMKEITIEEVAMSADTGAPNWLSKQWHMVHCAFMWQKMHRAMLSLDRRLEPSLLSYGHTEHCGRVISHDLPRDRLLTIITPQFEEC